MATTGIPANRLLAALPKAGYKLILPLLERVPLVFGKNIYKPEEPIQHVYFPECGIISILSSVGDSWTVEVGIVGDDGMVGMPTMVGVKNAPNWALVQGEGLAMRMTAGAFAKYSKDNINLHRVMLRYTHSLFVQVSQSAACNQFHRIDQRLARWLLMTRDRMHSNEFRITQEFLSSMLGVRREGVNLAAGAMQERGLVSYVRGYLTILDGKGLEKAACKCYEIIKREYQWKLN